MSRDMIHVTQDNINAGERQNSSKCPIAIALMATRSEPDDDWNAYCGRLLRHGDEITTHYLTSLKLSDIIRFYDIGGGMQPFSMIVDSDENTAYLAGELNCVL